MHQMLSSCPFLKYPSSKILSPGGARGVYLILYTQLKKMPDDVIEKSANHTANLQWCSVSLHAKA
jgi:hypothetical protein